jgi:hypothetical protein
MLNETYFSRGPQDRYIRLSPWNILEDLSRNSDESSSRAGSLIPSQPTIIGQPQRHICRTDRVSISLVHTYTKDHDHCRQILQQVRKISKAIQGCLSAQNSRFRGRVNGKLFLKTVGPPLSIPRYLPGNLRALAPTTTTTTTTTPAYIGSVPKSTGMA